MTNAKRTQRNKTSRSTPGAAQNGGALEFVSIAALTPHSRNPRKHDREQIRSLARSIEAFGFNAPILTDKNNQILCGHGRFEAAKLLGRTEVPVVRLDHLSEERARAYMVRVEVRADQLVVQLASTQKSKRGRPSGSTLQIPWHKASSVRRREILLPDNGLPPNQDARPIRSETRATLVASIARGRAWLDEMTTDPKATTESIAKRERCSPRKINKTISLAFLAPDLVKAAIEGRLPHGMGVARLFDLPAEWSRQRQVLGLSTQ